MRLPMFFWLSLPVSLGFQDLAGFRNLAKKRLNLCFQLLQNLGTVLCKMSHTFPVQQKRVGLSKKVTELQLFPQ